MFSSSKKSEILFEKKERKIEKEWVKFNLSITENEHSCPDKIC